MHPNGGYPHPNGGHPDSDSSATLGDLADPASEATQEAPWGLQIHGSLVEVRGVGVLILGPSGVGKSECVIELVRRGQRLVADDVVRMRLEPDGSLVGWSPEHIRHYIEVRGLGLLCVADLFGREATLDACAVDFVVRLAEPGAGAGFERIGLERQRERLLGVDVPRVELPVQAGSNLATIVDLAIRDWQLRLSGVNAARRLDERLRGLGERVPGGPSDEEGE